MLRNHACATAVRSTSALHCVLQEAEPTPYGSDKHMALLMISIPIMVLAVALAVLPLIVMSHSDHRRRKAETSSPNPWTPREAIATVDVPRAA